MGQQVGVRMSENNGHSLPKRYHASYHDGRGSCICPLETFTMLRQNHHSLPQYYPAAYHDGARACICRPETWILLNQDGHSLPKHHHTWLAGDHNPYPRKPIPTNIGFRLKFLTLNESEGFRPLVYLENLPCPEPRKPSFC